MQRTVLAMAAALSLLAGCASQVTSNPKTGVPVIQYEQKPFTPDIERVRASATAYHPTLTVGEVFDRYQFCESPSRLWEELEPGSIEFSCKLVPGGIFQVYWAADKEGVRLRSVTVTTMADAEFAGIDFRRDDAQAILKRVVENRLPPLD